MPFLSPNSVKALKALTLTLTVIINPIPTNPRPSPTSTNYELVPHFCPLSLSTVYHGDVMVYYICYSDEETYPSVTALYDLLRRQPLQLALGTVA